MCRITHSYNWATMCMSTASSLANLRTLSIEYIEYIAYCKVNTFSAAQPCIMSSPPSPKPLHGSTRRRLLHCCLATRRRLLHCCMAPAALSFTAARQHPPCPYYRPCPSNDHTMSIKLWDNFHKLMGPCASNERPMSIKWDHVHQMRRPCPSNTMPIKWWDHDRQMMGSCTSCAEHHNIMTSIAANIDAEVANIFYKYHHPNRRYTHGLFIVQVILHTWAV